MKALVHLPDPSVLSVVSSVRLEVGDEVGIYQGAWESAGPAGACGMAAAVVATSTITEAARHCQSGRGKPTLCPKPDSCSNRINLWRYSLAPLRECDPITDLPCNCQSCVEIGHHRARTCCDSGRVPLPEVPTGEAVLLQ